MELLPGFLHNPFIFDIEKGNPFDSHNFHNNRILSLHSNEKSGCKRFLFMLICVLRFTAIAYAKEVKQQ